MDISLSNSSKARKKAIDYICDLTKTKLYSVKHPLVRENKGGFRDIFSPNNLLYYSIVVSLARERGLSYIIGGQNKEDSEDSLDARTDFYTHFNSMLKICYDKQIEIIQPFINMSKEEVVKLGIELGVPLERTWSCQEAYEEPCKKCSSCKTRYKIADKLNIKL
ncbi:MAG: 7-cyano-7-deazaguanine synthase [Candidatus Heimdallarchaeaceae archaeon]